MSSVTNVDDLRAPARIACTPLIPMLLLPLRLSWFSNLGGCSTHSEQLPTQWLTRTSLVSSALANCEAPVAVIPQNPKWRLWRRAAVSAARSALMPNLKSHIGSESSAEHFDPRISNHVIAKL